MSKAQDVVNHPAHYELDKYECIDVMQEVFGVDALKSYCLIVAFKYLWRCDRKNNKREDIEKARWYLDKYLDLDKEHDEEVQ